MQQNTTFSLQKTFVSLEICFFGPSWDLFIENSGLGVAPHEHLALAIDGQAVPVADSNPREVRVCVHLRLVAYKTVKARYI